VKMPYIVIGVALLLLAVLIAASKLAEDPTLEYRPGEKVRDSVWRHPNLIFGATRNLRVRGRRSLHRSFLVNYSAKRTLRVCPQRLGRLRLVLLGRRHGRALSRSGGFAQD